MAAVFLAVFLICELRKLINIKGLEQFFNSTYPTTTPRKGQKAWLSLPGFFVFRPEQQRISLPRR